jgi:hypothetical protein
MASAALNVATPPTSLRQRTYETTCYTNGGDDELDPPSSPFLANVPDNGSRENISPVKSSKPSLNSVTKGSTSPLKMLKGQAAAPASALSPMKTNSQDRSPRKLSSPEKRFPIKVSLPTNTRFESQTEAVPLDDAIRNDRGLKKAIEILEDENTMLEYGAADGVLDGIVVATSDDPEHEGFADETAFSTFSAVPDMTMFARIGHSHSKDVAAEQTQRSPGKHTPSTLRRPMANDQQASPTPRQGHGKTVIYSDSGNTTNLILDFTEQISNLSNFVHSNISPTRRDRSSPMKSHTVPDLFTYTQNARTPTSRKNNQQPQSPTSRMSNLLDFDIPPAPTPRSMPTITPRELESLKSNFLSEISSLKASLSGKGAEVQSLKTAVGDAEKRVGESLEQLREEKNAKEQLAAEKEAWEKRGREMEQVLRNVKEEIVHGERERDALEGRLEESEKRREAAEIMAQEAESKMAGMRAGASSTNESSGDDMKCQAGSTSGDVEIAVEKVARELHTLYKSKHETKVAALKKSYENRWDKKVRDLEARLDELSKENEELRIGRDVTMSGVVPRIPTLDVTEELKSQAAKDAKAMKEMEAQLKGLSEEMKTVKQDNAQLHHELEQERVEKGELVAACDELLALQEAASANHPGVTSGVENLKSSISRASGLRAPNFTSGSAIPSADSRIGKFDRSRSGSTQGNRPGSGLSMRSGIMSSIEKMGSYKGRAE